MCVLRSEDAKAVGARLRKPEPVYTPDVELLLATLGECLQVVHTAMPSIHKEIGVTECAAAARSGYLLMRFVLVVG